MPEMNPFQPVFSSESKAKIWLAARYPLKYPLKLYHVRGGAHEDCNESSKLFSLRWGAIT